MSSVARLPLAPAIAAMFAAAAAILVLAMPQWRFDDAVAASRVADWLSIARPPLGTTARLVATVAAAALVGLVVFVAVALAERIVARQAAAIERRPGEDALGLPRQPHALRRPPLPTPVRA